MNVAISMSEARASLRRVKPWTWVILGGVCSILVGVGSIGWPRETLRVVAILFAVQLIAASLFRCIVVLSSEGRPGHMITMGALAGLSLVAGVLLLEDPTLSLGILAVVLGTYWLVHGVIEMIEAGGYRVWTDRAWTFVSGAMAIIVAIIIIAEATPIPFSVPYHTLMG